MRWYWIGIGSVLKKWYRCIPTPTVYIWLLLQIYPSDFKSGFVLQGHVYLLIPILVLIGLVWKNLNLCRPRVS